MAKNKNGKACIHGPTLYSIWLNRNVAAMDYTGSRNKFEVSAGRPLANFSNHRENFAVESMFDDMMKGGRALTLLIAYVRIGWLYLLVQRRGMKPITYFNTGAKRNTRAKGVR